MYNLNEVQPIDDYVKNLLKEAKNKYKLKINLDKPARGQRLEAALAMKDEGDGFNSMEIMVGRRVDSSDPLTENFTMLKMAETLSPSDPATFYNGFAHQYWPKKK